MSFENKNNVSELERGAVYQPGKRQKKETSPIDKRSDGEKAIENIDELYRYELKEIQKRQQEKEQAATPIPTPSSEDDGKKNETDKKQNTSTTPNKKLTTFTADDVNYLTSKERRSLHDAQKVRASQQVEEKYDTSLYQELQTITTQKPAKSIDDAKAFTQANKALEKMDAADKKAKELQSATNQGVMADLRASKMHVANWFLDDPNNIRKDYLTGRSKYLAAQNAYKRNLKDIARFNKEKLPEVEAEFNKANDEHKKYGAVFTPKVVQALKTAGDAYPASIPSLTPEEVAALEGIKTGFFSPKAPALLNFWQDIEKKKNRAEKVYKNLNLKLKAKQNQVPILEQKILEVQGEILASARPKTNEAIKELAQAAKSNPQLEKKNPALARLYKVLAVAIHISNTLDDLNKEQALLQLRTHSKLSEWREKYIHEFSSAEKLSEGHEKFTEAVNAAKKHLIKLEEAVQLQSSKLSSLEKSIEEELKINEKAKDSSSHEKTAKDAVADRLKKVRDNIKTDIAQIEKELKTFKSSLEDTITKANDAKARNNIPGWFDRVQGDFKVGNYFTGFATAIAGLTLLPTIGTAIAKHDYSAGWFGSVKKKYEDERYAACFLDATGTLIGTVLVAPMVLYKTCQYLTHADDGAPLSAELTKNGQPVKLVSVCNTSITKSFAENGNVDISADPSFLVITDSARRELILKFIGQCMREGLVNEEKDKDGKVVKRTLKMLSITNDQYRATLVVLLGQLGITPVGPAMEKPLHNEMVYNSQYTQETTWAKQQKEKFFLLHPEAQTGDEDKDMATFQFWWMENAMGYTQATEQVFKEEPDRGKPTPGGIQLADAAETLNPGGGVKLSDLEKNPNPNPNNPTNKPLLSNFNPPNGNGSGNNNVPPVANNNQLVPATNKNQLVPN